MSDQSENGTRTLTSWISRFARFPITIDCASMQLIVGHHGQPVCEGPGRITSDDGSAFRFMMYARNAPGQSVLARMEGAVANPYEIGEQFRLLATDYNGVEWNGGWTSPTLIGVPSIGWPLTGFLDGLLTQVKGPFVARESSVELAIRPEPRLPLSELMHSITLINGREVLRSSRFGEHTLELLGSRIEFVAAPSGEYLSIRASTSDILKHPDLENWLTEPLRIILGCQIFPQLVARNFGDGTAFVSLRRVPTSRAPHAITSLLDDPLGNPAEFWQLYGGLLSLIASATGEDGQPIDDRHPITKFYEEASQATNGSLWILNMVLAGAGEGLARLLMGESDQLSHIDPAQIERLRRHIEAWKGNLELRDRALGEVSKAGKKTVGRFMVELVGQGVLMEKHRKAWSKVRHAAMHGNVSSPFSAQEDEDRLKDLADLMHCLTRELVRRGSSTASPAAENRTI